MKDQGRKPANTAVLARLSAGMSAHQRRVTAIIGDLTSRYLDTGCEEKVAASIQKSLRLAVERYETGNSETEVRGVCVHAPTGYGKSRLCRHVLRSMPIFSEESFDDGTRPYVSVRCRAPCTLGSVGRDLLHAAGYGEQSGDILRNARTARVWQSASDRFEMMGTVLLHVDEINSLTKGANSVEVDKINDNLKGLLNSEAWPIVVLLSGTDEALPYLKRDPELVRRMDFIAIDPLIAPGDNDFLACAIEDLCKLAGIEPPASMERDLVPRLIHATTGAVGWPIDIAIRSIEDVLLAERKSLTRDDFAAHYARSTGRAADLNPFRARRWGETLPFLIPNDDD